MTVILSMLCRVGRHFVVHVFIVSRVKYITWAVLAFTDRAANQLVLYIVLGSVYI
jgi:hypothetical protein